MRVRGVALHVFEFALYACWCVVNDMGSPLFLFLAVSQVSASMCLITRVLYCFRSGVPFTCVVLFCVCMNSPVTPSAAIFTLFTWVPRPMIMMKPRATAASRPTLTTWRLQCGVSTRASRIMHLMRQLVRGEKKCRRAQHYGKLTWMSC